MIDTVLTVLVYAVGGFMVIGTAFWTLVFLGGLALALVDKIMGDL